MHRTRAIKTNKKDRLHAAEPTDKKKTAEISNNETETGKIKS